MPEITENNASPLELWAGVECTVNRVGDRFHDQLKRSGHFERESDLEAIRRLGVRTLRYPFLWEHAAPERAGEYDWSWAERRLTRLRVLGIEPIAGLLHHGSGPKYTSLHDPRFPELLADYAGAFARRFPWVKYYTPINEPLTTARFSGLYGFWYPHARDGAVFGRALYNQMRATVLAMRAIREVNSEAKLVQTEDLGTIHSTPDLHYQARFENHRRWLTWDLLSGRVSPKHPLYRFLRKQGLLSEELAWLAEQATPPDIVGINHYVTSDRFLDSRLSRYPSQMWGGNERDRYADVEAVRVPEVSLAEQSIAKLLLEAHARYRIPVAITEAHLGCTREEQLRWLDDVWRAAKEARAQGAEVRAVTAWALLGSFDWDSLVTRDRGHYESAAFDVTPMRNGEGLTIAEPRPTRLASMIRSLAEVGEFRHPLLETRGWWARETRCFGAVPKPITGPARPLLITGANGSLGRAFARICEARGIAYRLVGRAQMDIASADSVRRLLAEVNPWALVNAAGFVRIDEAEKSPEICFRENHLGPLTLARACAEAGIQLVTFSSDQVFDGRSGTPYRESSAVGPLNTYGRSKLEAERAVGTVYPEALVIRTSAFFGPWDDVNFVSRALLALRAGCPVVTPAHGTVSPTYIPELVHRALDLLIDGEGGLWHLANQGSITWIELARLVAERAGAHRDLVRSEPPGALGQSAPRPAYSVLDTERGAPLSGLDCALGKFFDEMAIPQRMAS